MTVITLFEHHERSYTSMGINGDEIGAQLDRLNAEAGVELIRVGRDSLRAHQYVGIIRAHDVTLQVFPKVDYQGSTEQPGTPAYIQAARSATYNLLHMLDYTHDIRLRQQDAASLAAEPSDWFELLTRFLALELHTQIKQGMEHAYRKVEAAQPVMRGRWDIQKQVRQSPHMKHRFHVRYDSFVPDTPLNRVFRFLTEHLLLASRDRTNRRLLTDIREWLVEVRRSPSIQSLELDRIHFTRLNIRFQYAFNFARLFLESTAPQLVTGERQAFAFLFDMNMLFESFVVAFLQRHRDAVVPSHYADVQITAQSRGRPIYLAQQLPAGQDAFRLRPDIMLTTPEQRPLLVVDTKYKRVDEQRRQAGVAESDFYQMLAYTTRLNCPFGLLLYPQSAHLSRVVTSFRVPSSNIRIDVGTIDLQQPLNQPAFLIQEFGNILTPIFTEVR